MAKRSWITSVLASPVAVAAVALGTALHINCATAADAEAASAQTLAAFRSEKELRQYFSRFPRQPLRRFGPLVATARQGIAPANVASAESITNTQHAGVDEGGIVKLHGQYLVVLRRGPSLHRRHFRRTPSARLKPECIRSWNGPHRCVVRR